MTQRGSNVQRLAWTSVVVKQNPVFDHAGACDRDSCTHCSWAANHPLEQPDLLEAGAGDELLASPVAFH